MRFFIAAVGKKMAFSRKIGVLFDLYQGTTAQIRANKVSKLTLPRPSLFLTVKLNKMPGAYY
jgi:hypothetical protein